MEISGTQTKEDVGTGFDEVSGNKSRGHGYVVGIQANRDEMYVRTQGSATMKSGVIENDDRFAAGDVGADCDFVARGKTIEDILRQCTNTRALPTDRNPGRALSATKPHNRGTLAHAFSPQTHAESETHASGRFVDS